MAKVEIMAVQQAICPENMHRSDTGDFDALSKIPAIQHKRPEKKVECMFSGILKPQFIW